MTTTAPNTSRIASIAARRADFPYSVMCRSMFSITTIASSTTMPVASTMPNSVSVLIEKSNSLMNAKVPISETGMVTAGNHRAAPVLEEQEHHDDHEDDGLAERLQHLDDRLADDADVVEGQQPLEPGRKARIRDPAIVSITPLVDVERVGRRQQRDAHPSRFELEEAQVGGVLLGAELDPAHVLDAHERASLAGLHDDVLEFIDLGEPSDRAHAHREHLAGLGGLVAERAGRHLHVLLAQRVQHVAGCQASGRELAGIQPQPHRVAPLAEDDHVAHARHALEGIADVQIEVVADVQVAVAVVPAEEADPAHEPGGHLGHGDSVGTDVGRHPPEGGVDAVLHVDGGQVVIARDVEGDRDGGDPRVGGRGGHVGHALDAVDHLLERRRDRALHRLRVGAGVEGRDRDGRRRELGIPRNRQRGDGDGAGENDQQRADRREDGPLDEHIREHG